jgi:hypothetical protein
MRKRTARAQMMYRDVPNQSQVGFDPAFKRQGDSRVRIKMEQGQALHDVAEAV